VKNNFLKSLKIKFIKVVQTAIFVVAFFSFVSLFSPGVNVVAQSQTTGTEDFLALRACQNPNPTAGGGSANIIACFRQVSTIAVIVGIILGGIMTARDVLTTYIPGQEANAGGAMQKRIRDLITGLVLVSLPGAILNLFNPATTNIDFLSRLGSLQRQAPETPTKTPATPGTNTGTPGNNTGSPGANTGTPGTGTNTNTPTTPVTNGRAPQTLTLSGEYRIVKPKLFLISEGFHCSHIDLLTQKKTITVCNDSNSKDYWENYATCIQVNEITRIVSVIENSTCAFRFVRPIK